MHHSPHKQTCLGGGVQENHITSENTLAEQSYGDTEYPSSISINGIVYYLSYDRKWVDDSLVVTSGTAHITGYDSDLSSIYLSSYITYNNMSFEVTSINDRAFSNCTSLTSIKIPGSVTSIGDYAFSNCTALSTVEISDGVISIGHEAFSECSSLVSIAIPDSITSIGGGAFSYCTSLISIEIPDSVTSIEWGTFIGCSSLTSLIIPNSVTSIGDSAFEYCTLLASIKLSDYATSLGYNAFAQCTSLERITVPGSVESIKTRTFDRCTSLSSIEIENGVSSIENEAFDRCTSLISIKIPGSVTSIGSYSFFMCDSLKSIELGYGVSTIGDWAFAYTALEKLTLPGSIVKLGNSFCAFTPLKSVIIEEGLQSIENSVFSECNDLQSISIPNTVSMIDHYAFTHCYSLTSIIIPGSVKLIGYDAFYGCTEMVTIILEEGVETIESGAFNTNALISVVIPSSVKSIGTYVFDNSWSPSLTSIYFKCPFDSLMYDRGVSSFLEVEYLYYKYAPDADKWIQYGKESGRQVTPFYYVNYYDGDVLVEQRIVRDGDKLPEQYFENKDDEIFSGWVTDSGEHFSSKDKVKDNVDVQTSFIPRNEKRTITFVSDGSLVYNRMIVSPDDTITISHEKPSNGSNKFICWNTEEDGTGVSYYAGDSIAIGSSDIALYALWEYQSPSESPFIEGSFIIFGLIVFLFVIIIIIALLVRRRRKKRKQ